MTIYDCTAQFMPYENHFAPPSGIMMMFYIDLMSTL